MAEKRETRKAQLSAELAQARSALSRQRAAVNESLDFNSRIHRSVSRNAVVWIGGAVLAGFVLSRLPARKTKVKFKRRHEMDTEGVAKTGLLLAIAKIAFDVARPALTKAALTQLQPLIEKAMGRWRAPR